MNGDICVTSEVGRGSTFHFTAMVDVADEQLLEACTLEPVRLADVKVLVVDDNATNRRILEETLRSWGMASTSASGAHEGLEQIRLAQAAGTPFRLVLTDSQMPDEDGFEFVEELHEDDQLGGTVIMMLTSGDRPGDISRCEELGIASYMLKPVKQSELFEAISRALGEPVAKRRRRDTRIDERLARIGSSHILLAEDSLVNQKLAVALLQKYGNTVVVANNGREALAALETQEFDFVLMDVQMPDMDGFEATATLRQREQETGAHIPVIAMTAYAMKGDRERCLKAGMDDYVSKPIHAETLFDTIAAVLGQSSPTEPRGKSVTESAESIVDWGAALEAVDGEESLLHTLVEAVLEESPQILDSIRRAVADQDAISLCTAAHTLKGSIRYFRADRAFDAAFRLERMGRDGHLAEAEEVLLILEKETGRILSLLQAYLHREIAGSFVLGAVERQYRRDAPIPPLRSASRTIIVAKAVRHSSQSAFPSEFRRDWNVKRPCSRRLGGRSDLGQRPDRARRLGDGRHCRQRTGSPAEHRAGVAGSGGNRSRHARDRRSEGS